MCSRSKAVKPGLQGLLVAGLALLTLVATSCLPPTLPVEEFVPKGGAADANDVADTAALAEVGADADSGGTDAGEAGSIDAGCSAAKPCPPSTTPCFETKCENGTCEPKAISDGGSCNDGDACTTGDVCTTLKCAGIVNSCNDNNVCTKDACDAKTGQCVYVNVATLPVVACDDGDPCTTGDRCEGGKCKPVTLLACQCKNDGDCAAKDNKTNLCLGKHFCDTSKVPYTCKVSVPTVVVCSAEDVPACFSNTCEPASGECKLVQKKDGTGCNDGIACTKSDLCEGGKCTFTPASNECECFNDAGCAAWKDSDKDKCNGAYFCELASHKCKLNPTTVVTCNTADDSICRRTLCTPATGKCVAQPIANLKKKDDLCEPDVTLAATKCPLKLKKPEEITAQDALPANEKPDFLCDDGNACTQNDSCNGLVCSPGTTNTCKCTKDGDCASEEDGDKCNGTLFCNLKLTPSACQLNAATIVNCGAGGDTQCAHNVCDPKDGKCKFLTLPNLKQVPANCSAGNCGKPCYPDKGEKCMFQPKNSDLMADLNCDDNDVCTAVTQCTAGGQCLPPQADPKPSFICSCTNDAACQAKDDGDLCNGTLFCDKKDGVCKLNPASVVFCQKSSDTECLRNVCHPKTGKCAMTPTENLKHKCNDETKPACAELVPGEATATNVLCDDGNPCSSGGDHCSKGQCLAGTADTCKCKVDSDCAKEEDGNFCNGTMYCNKVPAINKESGTCIVNPATIVTCSPASDTTCIRNTCKTTTGKCEMVPESEFKGCSDGNPCSVSDTCTGGVCASTANICSCTKDAECVDDGDLCNGTLYCDKAAVPFACAVNPSTVVKCPGAFDTPCSKNTCTQETGKCAMKAVFGYVPCVDGNPCTSGDLCDGGKCVPGTNLCGCTTDESCGVKEDGDLCTGALFCDKSVSSFVCKPIAAQSTTCAPASADTCLMNLCNASTGKCMSLVVADDQACNDNKPCTADSCDAKGNCSHVKVADKTACGASNTCVDGVCN